MNFERLNDRKPSEIPPRINSWSGLIVLSCVLVILLALIVPPSKPTAPNGSPGTNTSLADRRFERRLRTVEIRRGSHSGTESKQTAEQIVADKVKQFGRSRRQIVDRISRRTAKEVPPEVEAFFDAVETGDWDQIAAQWKSLAVKSGQYAYSSNAWDAMNPFWPAVLDAYGVAEQAHEWPAQKLLDYGNAILDSMRPGMVYVGGTDDGRWVPELLNETSGGQQHIIVTQNALADGRYLDFVNELYGDQFKTLTKDDADRIFQQYTADAQKRLEHDQQFPDEPKQIRPGEGIKIQDGRVQVSGQFSVMEINEQLLHALMQKNPDLSFAMQESFPFKGTYASATPMGPLMELLQSDQNSGFNQDQAALSVDYWRNIAQNVLADPEATNSPYTLRAYSHNVDSTANLLAAHYFTAEAEQAYQLASQICPYNPEAISGLANIYAQSGRADQARQILDNFAAKYPDQRPAIEKSRGSISWTVHQ